eukprot:CAMPEP_0115319650 /NCGR_PEP_ID=MMETSP0270-20121206/79883_1 /TAXON_ID=71861 /ORGANISM="Scrippsiella trochoidea, Strain CCMP3099" /LENGTH=48 /DNA_ID= /DNA_START= /DNA_END= /DNA_ORIENTATION=
MATSEASYSKHDVRTSSNWPIEPLDEGCGSRISNMLAGAAAAAAAAAA